MIKYVKWFLLIILIVCLTITVVMFINYGKFKMSDIYNYMWYKTGIAVYENDELFSKNEKLSSSYYMSFTKDNVIYCDYDTNECDEYSYSYNDDEEKLTINSENYFLSKGTYDIKFENNVLELSIIENDIKTIYYFNSPVG